MRSSLRRPLIREIESTGLEQDEMATRAFGVMGIDLNHTSAAVRAHASLNPVIATLKVFDIPLILLGISAGDNRDSAHAPTFMYIIPII